MLPTGLLQVEGGQSEDARQKDALRVVKFSPTGLSCFRLRSGESGNPQLVCVNLLH